MIFFLMDIRWWLNVKNDGLYFTDDNLYRVVISKDAYELMREYCISSNLNETGGILIGNYSSDQKTANILKITPPPLTSRKTRYSFKRGTKGLKDILDSMWEQGLFYLGEWHYHPKASPFPSSTDIKQMIDFANESELKCPEPILVILGESCGEEALFIGVFNEHNYVTLHSC